MFGIETLPAMAQAAAEVGLVSLEAFVLYLGYGTLTDWVSPRLRRALGGS